MALVMTVLVLTLLAVLGYAFSYSAAVNLHAARNAGDALRRECEAESALNYAMALLQADGGSGDFDTLEERWADPDLVVAVGEGRYAIRIIDEDRNLNVNAAVLPPKDPDEAVDLRPVLKRLVRRAGGGDGDFDALVAWVDPDKPLPMIAGLRAAPDLDPELFVTGEDKPALDGLLATHPDWINLNTAREELLDALWNDSEMTRAVMDRRSEQPFRSTSDIHVFLTGFTGSDAVEKSESLLDVQSRFFTVRVSPDTQGAAEGLSALVSRTEGNVHILNVRRDFQEGTP